MDLDRMEREARADARDRANDLRLREVLRGPTDLIRSPYRPARGLVRWPDRITVRPKPVAHGYVIGSSADAAAQAMGLETKGLGLTADGQPMAYVESPTEHADRTKRTKSDAAYQRQAALVRKADAAHGVLSLSDAEVAAVVGKTGYLD